MLKLLDPTFEPTSVVFEPPRGGKPTLREAPKSFGQSRSKRSFGAILAHSWGGALSGGPPRGGGKGVNKYNKSFSRLFTRVFFGPGRFALVFVERWF